MEPLDKKKLEKHRHRDSGVVDNGHRIQEFSVRYNHATLRCDLRSVNVLEFQIRRDVIYG